MRPRTLTLSLLLAFLAMVSARAVPIADAFVVPDDHAVLKVFGDAEPAGQLDPHCFRVVVWNIQKSKHRDWLIDLPDLVRGRELVLLQEVRMTPDHRKTYEQRDRMRWDFAAAFMESRTGAAAGVATGSITKPTGVEFRRSPIKEPVVKTPKLTLITRYALSGDAEDKCELLVANVHGINFRGEAAFRRQLDDVMTEVNDHRGPVLFAGDFNTWSQDRTDYLKTTVRRAGLTQVEFPKGRKTFMRSPLDHVLVRGLQVVSSRVRTDITTSDHHPLEVVLKAMDNCCRQETARS